MSNKKSSWRPDADRTDRALQVARRVVSAEGAIDALAEYYTVESDYAGATFSNLEPQDPGRVTPADLLAVTTLSVDVPPIAIRRLMGHAETAQRVSELLGRLPTELGIEAAEGHAGEMAEFYELVKSSLHRHGTQTSNAWVTASKICARKRPRLFPVRDNVVMNVLDLKGSYPYDWPVFAALMADQDLGRAIDSAVQSAQARQGVDVGDDTLRLRHLDVLLWMAGVKSTR